MPRRGLLLFDQNTYAAVHVIPDSVHAVVIGTSLFVSILTIFYAIVRIELSGLTGRISGCYTHLEDEGRAKDEAEHLPVTAEEGAAKQGVRPIFRCFPRVD